MNSAVAVFSKPRAGCSMALINLTRKAVSYISFLGAHALTSGAFSGALKEQRLNIEIPQGRVRPTLSIFWSQFYFTFCYCRTCFTFYTLLLLVEAHR